MGIAEQNTLGTALGFAISDKIPIVSGFSIFTIGRAWEFIMASLPNLKIFVPSDNVELIQMLYYSIDNEGPFFIRLPRNSFPLCHSKEYNFSLENPDILKKGHDICLIGIGYGAYLAYDSAPKIEKTLKISVKVINLSVIKPINVTTLINEIKDLSDIAGEEVMAEQRLAS